MSPRLANAISAHSWSPDETTLALSPNSSEIKVYEASEQGVMHKQCTLREHSQLVSDIDWNREGSFASCSHDSSAYVWTRNGDAWKPELVFTRLRLAALCLKWNPAGDTFAIGSSERLICICHKDKRNNCWSARLIRKGHSSSVTAVAWSPCGSFLASTSTDGRCMLFSMGSRGAAEGDKSAFGTVLLDIEAGSGWGLGVSWSPSGGQLAVTSHGSTVRFLSGLHEALTGSTASELQPGQLLRLEQLPLRCVEHLSETKVIGAGFDGEVYLFERAPGGAWAQSELLSPSTALSEASAQAGKLSAAFRDKLALFKGHTSHESSTRGVRETAPEQLQAPHSNVIVGMHIFRSPDGTPTGKFSTAGWDGKVLLWQIDLADTIKAVH